jgi:hypothetical protein
MTPTGYGAIFAVGLLIGMIALLVTGRRVGVGRLAQDPDGAQKGLGVVEGAVLSLLGLLIAFTFAGAVNRFDDRRRLVIEEANNIGTAYLRIDLLPESARPAMRQRFRDYLDARLSTYRKLPDLAASKAELGRSQELQREIWTSAVAACRESGSQPAHVLLLPALNAMFDIVTTRTQAMTIHPPVIIWVMIGVVSLSAALLAGYGMAGSKSASPMHILAFAVVTALTVYVITDIEYPRFGLIKVAGADRVLEELRATMN